MATFAHISGAEPSTVTFKAATITQTRNSSVMHQEIISLGDPDSSLAVAAVLAAAPASTAWGLVTRPMGPVTIQGNSTVVIQGNSTVVFLPAYLSTAVAPNNSTALNVRVVGGVSSAVDFPVRAVLSSTSADNPVQISGNSTAFQGTSPWVIAGNSTVVFLPAYLSTAVAPNNSTALNVRVVGGASSAADFLVRAVLSSTNTDNPVRAVFSSTNTDNPVRAVLSSTAADNPVSVANLGTSSGFPSSGSSGLIVRQVWDIRASAASTNAMAASTAFSVASSAVGKVYVTAYSITSTVQAPTVLRFMSGSTLLWPVVLAALSSAVTGVNLAGYPFLFVSPAAGRPLTLNIASTVAGFRVGVSYFRAP